MKTGLEDLSQGQIHDRIRVTSWLPDTPENISVRSSYWERLISFRFPKGTGGDLFHQQIILREVAKAKNNRFLPLHQVHSTPEQLADKDFGYSDWVWCGDSPIPIVGEEVRQVANEFCAGVLQLQERGLVEVTFIIDT